MTEIELMERAKKYLDSMVRGVDPLSGAPLRSDDIVMNDRISKCLQYVSGVLERDMAAMTGKSEASARGLSEEQISALLSDDSEISASKVAVKINGLMGTDIKNTDLINWLEKKGLIFSERIWGKLCRRPTEEGLKIGIREVTYKGDNGNSNPFCVYGSAAQRFIYEHIGEIIG